MYEENESDFDLIISDMKMLILNGPELFKSLREKTRLKQPKFIFITGGVNVNFEDSDAELKQMIDGYFLKPFVMEEIQQVLCQCLGAFEITQIDS